MGDLALYVRMQSFGLPQKGYGAIVVSASAAGYVCRVPPLYSDGSMQPALPHHFRPLQANQREFLSGLSRLVRTCTDAVISSPRIEMPPALFEIDAGWAVFSCPKEGVTSYGKGVLKDQRHPVLHTVERLCEDYIRFNALIDMMPRPLKECATLPINATATLADLVKWPRPTIEITERMYRDAYASLRECTEQQIVSFQDELDDFCNEAHILGKRLANQIIAVARGINEDPAYLKLCLGELEPYNSRNEKVQDISSKEMVVRIAQVLTLHRPNLRTAPIPKIALSQAEQ